jgi:hypothetical protein
VSDAEKLLGAGWRHDLSITLKLARDMASVD